MKRSVIMSLCVPLLGACAENGFDPLSALAPSAGEVQELDSASTSQLYLSVVNGLLAQGRYRAALAYLDQYAVKEERTPHFRQLHGEALLGTEQYDEAIAAFSSLESTGLAPEGFSGLGRVKATQGDWPVAVSYFERAVALRPASAEFLNNLGYARLVMDDDSLAEAEFNLRQAQELDPASESIRTNLLIALTLAGKDEEAERLLSGIPVPKKRAEVRRFATDWVKQHHVAADVAKEDM
jgi:Flp pilus assembly protein TadD